MRTWAVLFLLAALGGCTTTTYSKADVTTEQLAQDAGECEARAKQPALDVTGTFLETDHVITPVRELNRPVFNACMAERGYDIRASN